ncbi:FAR1-related protein [Striga asiatica]|uniref:FAR1-related protein n=1 Tax=Striga asiatica TaxID=4170 RepID=A0A5A7PV85_STRAF|nr:FAR1-related protein [Striga asiatica]
MELNDSQPGTEDNFIYTVIKCNSRFYCVQLSVHIGAIGGMQTPVTQQLLITPGGTKHWIPQCHESIKPYQGQIFRELHEAVNFYKTYALTVGFDVRHSTLAKARDKTVIWKYIVCSREGYKQRAVISPTTHAKGHVTRRRVSSRVGCTAKIGVRYDGLNGYIVKIFEEKHSHSMISDACKSQMKISRSMNAGHRSFSTSKQKKPKFNNVKFRL